MPYHVHHRRRRLTGVLRRSATVAALTATSLLAALTFGAAASHADVGVPVSPPYVQTDSLADTVAEAAQIAAAVTTYAQNCTTADGLCTYVVATASDALGIAQQCIQALSSELGVSPTAAAALGSTSLDCGEVARLGLGLAQFVLQTVNECTTGANATCQTVFDAARLGLDKAVGCLGEALWTVGVPISGTDPDCAAAIGMLYREAEGLVAMLTACLNGTDALCTLAQQYAQFAIDGLTGCAGTALWVTAGEVEQFPPGGPLPCYAVLDQVAVAINSLLGQVPGLPTQITPTDDDCSITVAVPIPTFEISDPSMTTRYADSGDAFVPSCSEPEAVYSPTNVTTPGSTTLGLDQGPTCQSTDTYVIDKTTTDNKKMLWHRIYTNVNANKLHIEINETITKGWDAKITAGAETELNIWVHKVKVELKVEAGVHRDMTWSVKAAVDIPSNTEGHFGSFVWDKVVEGRTIEQYDDCSEQALFRRVRTPYKDNWFYWEEPYNGDKPA